MSFKKFFLGLSLLAATGCAADLKVETSEPREEPSPITWTDCSNVVGDHPCDFTLQDQNGDDWSLYENYGSAIILDFSAEWCSYCQVAAAGTQHVSDSFEDLIYVTILIEDTTREVPSSEVLNRWADYFNIEDPVLSGDRSMLGPGGQGVWEVTGWPTFFIVDKEMRIDSIIRGYSAQSLEAAVLNVTEKSEDI